MHYEQILYDVADRIATVTLNRPQKLNAWTSRMNFEVQHALCSADRDPGVLVIIVTGAGKGYCAGADMDMLQGLQGGTLDAEGALGDAQLPSPADATTPEAFRGPYSYPLGLSKPVIAAVNGAAVGLGLSYMLYYDLRIASDRARFSTIFARRGLVAEHGLSWMLPRLVGMANACDLLFSGRLVDAAEALRMGLVNRVVPHDDLLRVTHEVAAEIATFASPRSVRIMKRQIYTDLSADLATAITAADEEMVASFGTDDFREGIASFLERRPPRFAGK